MLETKSMTKILLLSVIIRGMMLLNVLSVCDLKSVKTKHRAVSRKCNHSIKDEENRTHPVIAR